jgi:transcriptional regulator with XRE-family HTH domain
MSRRRYKTLREFVERTGTKQADLAGLLGVSESSVSNYLNGKRIPQPDIALRIEALGVDLRSILTREAA